MILLKRFAYACFLCLPMLSCESGDEVQEQSQIEGPLYWNVIKTDNESVKEQILNAMNIDGKMSRTNDTLVVALSDEVLIEECSRIASNYNTDELSWFIFRNDCDHYKARTSDAVFSYSDTIFNISEASAGNTITVNGTKFNVKMASNTSSLACETIDGDNKFSIFEIDKVKTLCTWGSKHSSYLSNFQKRSVMSDLFFITPDLNADCGMMSDYVYAGINIAESKLASSSKTLTDIAVVKDNKNETITIPREIPYYKDGKIVYYKKDITYQLATSYHGNKNLNSDAGGDALYLYTTNQYVGRQLYATHPSTSEYYYNEMNQTMDNATIIGTMATWSGNKLPTLSDLRTTIDNELAAAGSTASKITTDFIRLYDKEGKLMDEDYPANFNRNARGSKEIFISVPYKDTIRTIDSKVDLSLFYKDLYSNLNDVENPISFREIKVNGNMLIIYFDVDSHGNYKKDGLDIDFKGELYIELQGYVKENSGIKEYYCSSASSIEINGYIEESVENGITGNDQIKSVSATAKSNLMKKADHCFFEQFPDGSYYFFLGLTK